MDPLLGQPAGQLQCAQPGREPRQNPLPIGAAVNQDGDFQVKPGQQLGIQVNIHGFKGDRGGAQLLLQALAKATAHPGHEHQGGHQSGTGSQPQGVQG